jgi:hypothetical protein
MYIGQLMASKAISSVESDNILDTINSMVDGYLGKKSVQISYELRDIWFYLSICKRGRVSPVRCMCVMKFLQIVVSMKETCKGI